MKKGFTLIELLVVISIIGLLSSVVLASVTKVRDRARVVSRLASANQIYTALQMYINDHKHYPDVNTGSGNGIGTIVDFANSLSEYISSIDSSTFIFYVHVCSAETICSEAGRSNNQLIFTYLCDGDPKVVAVLYVDVAGGPNPPFKPYGQAQSVACLSER